MQSNSPRYTSLRLLVVAGGLALVGGMLFLGCVIPRSFPLEDFATFLLLHGALIFAFLLAVYQTHDFNERQHHHPVKRKSFFVPMTRKLLSVCPSLCFYSPILLMLITFPPVLYLSSSHSLRWETAEF